MNSGGDGFSRNCLVCVGVTQVKAAVWHMLLAGSVQLSSQQTQGDISRGPDLAEALNSGSGWAPGTVSVSGRISLAASQTS